DLHVLVRVKSRGRDGLGAVAVEADAARLDGGLRVRGLLPVTGLFLVVARVRALFAGLALAIGLVGCAGQNPGETPPACAWAAVAEPGARIQAMVLGTAKFAVPEDAPAGYLLIGDAASIPAINSIIEVV